MLLVYSGRCNIDLQNQKHVVCGPSRPCPELRVQYPPDNNVRVSGEAINVLGQAGTRPTQEILVYTIYTDRRKGQLSLGWRNRRLKYNR